MVSPMDTNYAPLATDIIDKLESIVKKANVKRLVIDSVMTIKYASGDPKVEKKEMTRFIRSLKDLGCTTILLSEMTDPNKYSTEQFLAHGVIFLQNFFTGDDMVRACQVIKMRGTKHDCAMHRMEFTPDGLKIDPEKYKVE